MADDDVTLNSGYGPITVPRFVYALWQKYGWPTEHVLKHIARHGVECSCREPLGD